MLLESAGAGFMQFKTHFKLVTVTVQVRYSKRISSCIVVMHNTVLTNVKIVELQMQTRTLTWNPKPLIVASPSHKSGPF